MRYKAKNIAALHIVLSGLPNKMRVQVDPDIGVSAKTVGELQKARELGDNDPTGTLSRKRGKDKQGYVTTRYPPKQ
jgi:hypothetical protein